MAVKAVAAQQSKEPECILLSETNTNALTSLQSMQAFATVAEKNLWRRCGCKLENDVWMSVDGKPCLPRHYFFSLIMLNASMGETMEAKGLW